VVPTAAVQRGPNGTFVYVVQADQKVTVRPVTLTQQDDEQSVIATGLSAGEQVVTTGFAQLAEGKQVRISDGSAPPAWTPPRGRPQARERGGDAPTERPAQRPEGGERPPRRAANPAP